MKKIFLFSFIASLFLLTGCSNAELSINGDKDVMESFSSLQAMFDEDADADTRVFINDGSSSGNKGLSWNDNDQILLFSDVQPNLVKYTLQTIENGKGVFGGDKVTGNSFYALYPSYNWTLDNANPNIIHFYLGEGGDSYGHGKNDFSYAGPMIAKSSTNSFIFKQILGMIHFSISGFYRLEGIVFRGNNNEILRGYGTIDLSVSNPVFKLDNQQDEPVTYMSLYLNDSKQLLNGGEFDIYFPVPTISFEKGFSLQIYGYDQSGSAIEITKTYNSEFTINRAEVEHFSLVDYGAEIESIRLKTKAALKAFYDALDGDHWNNNSNWNTDAPFDQWYGVGVYNGVVTQINMWGNNLRGEIPAKIADINTLNQLDLGNNHITSIADGFYQSRSLTDISLVSNYLSGPLPVGFLGMTNMSRLNLGNNYFEGEIPDSYFNSSSNLNYLSLYGNKLQGVISMEKQQTAFWKNLEYRFLNPQQTGYGIIIEGAVNQIVLDREQILLCVGETAQLVVKSILPENALNKNLLWEFNDEYISFDQNTGTITAKKEGDTYIRVLAADNNGANADCVVYIVNPANRRDSDGNEKFKGENQNW